jgi:hypothetical protein
MNGTTSILSAWFHPVTRCFLLDLVLCVASIRHLSVLLGTAPVGESEAGQGFPWLRGGLIVVGGRLVTWRWNAFLTLDVQLPDRPLPSSKKLCSASGFLPKSCSRSVPPRGRDCVITPARVS